MSGVTTTVSSLALASRLALLRLFTMKPTLSCTCRAHVCEGVVFLFKRTRRRQACSRAHVLGRQRVVHVLAGLLQGLRVDGLEGAVGVHDRLRGRRAARAAHHAAVRQPGRRGGEGRALQAGVRAQAHVRARRPVLQGQHNFQLRLCSGRGTRLPGSPGNQKHLQLGLAAGSSLCCRPIWCGLRRWQRGRLHSRGSSAGFSSPLRLPQGLFAEGGQLRALLPHTRRLQPSPCISHCIWVWRIHAVQ